MFLAALIIASKYATDRALSSGTWATHIIGQNNGIRNVSEVNSIQQEFLSIMEYELFIQHENFNHWMDELKEYTILKYKYLSSNNQKQAMQWKSQQTYWFKRLSIAANMKRSNSSSSLEQTNNTSSSSSYPSQQNSNVIGNPFLVFYQNKKTSLPSPTSPITKKNNSTSSSSTIVVPTPSSQVIPLKQNISVIPVNNNNNTYPRYNYIQRVQVPTYVINNNTLTPLSSSSTPFVPNKNISQPYYYQNNNTTTTTTTTNINNKRTRSSSTEYYPVEKKIKYNNQIIPTPPSNSRMFININ